jgi:hypothetical protein
LFETNGWKSRLIFEKHGKLLKKVNKSRSESIFGQRTSANFLGQITKASAAAQRKNVKNCQLRG